MIFSFNIHCFYLINVFVPYNFIYFFLSIKSIIMAVYNESDKNLNNKLKFGSALLTLQ